MHRQKLALLLIILLGGTSVLASYIYPIMTQPQYVEPAWGGVTPDIRRFYVPSMLLAASGCALVYVSPFFRPQGEYQEVEVQRAEGWLTAKKILLLDIDGVIVDKELAELLMTTESTVART